MKTLLELLARARLIWGRCRRGRAKADGNAKELDAEALALGASVAVLDEVGDDVPDRLYGAGGRDALVEYKRDGKRPSDRGKLSAGQQAFRQLWRGRTPETVWTKEDVRRVVLALRGGP